MCCCGDSSPITRPRLSAASLEAEALRSSLQSLSLSIAAVSTLPKAVPVAQQADLPIQSLPLNLAKPDVLSVPLEFVNDDINFEQDGG